MLVPLLLLFFNILMQVMAQDVSAMHKIFVHGFNMYCINIILLLIKVLLAFVSLCIYSF